MRVRPYVHATDFDAVGRLLLEAYRPGEVFDPWLQPRWEYMHVHPLVRGLDRSRFGVAEDDDGQVVAVVHNEHTPHGAGPGRRAPSWPGSARTSPSTSPWASSRGSTRRCG
jgi:hypothetical protein